MSKRVGPEVCTAGRMFARLRWLALFTSGLALGGCLKPTPFGSDTDEHQLNRFAMENLQTPRSTERVRFVALGDTHDAYDELWEATAAINRAPGVDFVLHTGDVTDFGLAQEFEWTARALSGVRFPALVVIGNHDAISNGKAVYRELYGPFDFSFSYGGYKFVLFNSNALEFEGAAPDRAWLESELSDLHGADAVVLVTHQNPQAPDGPSASDDSLFYEQLLLRYPIALIVHGHLEELELATWHRVPRLQLGTFSKTHDFSVVTLSGSRVEVETCDVNGCSPSRSLELGTSDETSP